MTEAIRIGAIELRFLQAGAATDASLDLFEMTLQPGGRMPVPHYHETWDETIYGLAGVITWRRAGQDVEVAPGDSLFIRRGVVHGFANNGSRPATCLCVLTPGRLGLSYFREIAALAAGGDPDPAAMRAIMARHGLVPVPAG